jgi:hypothetical protein
MLARQPFSLDLTKETKHNFNRERVYSEHPSTTRIDNISRTNCEEHQGADNGFQ